MTENDVETVKIDYALMGGEIASVKEVETLRGGLSGSGVYRLSLADGTTLILKATPAGVDPCIQARAEREASFYRTLAHRIPLRTPRIRSQIARAEVGVFLLMDDYAAAPPPRDWSERDYLRIAGELGRFHAAFWNRTAEFYGRDELRRVSTETPDDAFRSARSAWMRLSEEPKFSGILTKDRLENVERWLSRRSALEERTNRLPETLIHGDCHIGNLLTDGEDFVWTDWQEVRIGRGPVDVSFLLQRAAFEGGTAPYDEALVAYHASLEASLGESVSLAFIRDAANASEMRSRLFDWPHYLGYADERGMEAFLDRLSKLASELSVE